MTKFGIFMTKLNMNFGYSLFLKLIDMIQLDLYIGVFLQLTNVKIRGYKASVNIAFAVIALCLFLFSKLIVYWISTRIAIIDSEKN